MSTVSEAHIRGNVSFEGNTDGSLSDRAAISGTSTLSQTINGEGEVRKNLTGQIANNPTAYGILSDLVRIRGQGSIPSVIGRNQIHYDTKEAWNAQTELVGERGHIYIYSNYATREVEKDGETHIINIPAMKVGDGLAYLIDTPFMLTSDDYQEFIDHINNLSIHVMPVDRTNWNEKVSADVDQDMLIFI